MPSPFALGNGLGSNARRAAYASAALCAFLGCSSSGNGSNPPAANGGTSAASGGSSGTVATGGTTQNNNGGSGNTTGGTGNGTSGSAGAAQGGSMSSAGAGGAATVTVANNAGKYSLTVGQTYLEVDPANGARITALRVGGAAGMDVVASSAVTGDPDNWGSTFWPSPQSWPWPPTSAASIGAINTSPYTVTSDATSITLTSGLAAAPTVSVIKKISGDAAKEAIVIDYTMTNGGTAAVTVAPWEITRVAAGGITFYGTGTGAPGPGNFPLPPAATITTGAGATWYKDNPADLTDYKLFADGAGGWLAHAAGDLLLVKSFPDVAAGAAATNEAEIEIYSSKTGKYVEVEQQGAVQMLAPAATLNWTVRWYARKLPMPAAVGSADLVTYVQNLIK